MEESKLVAVVKPNTMRDALDINVQLKTAWK
jgi:hypothetical protein